MSIFYFCQKMKKTFELSENPRNLNRHEAYTLPAIWKTVVKPHSGSQPLAPSQKNDSLQLGNCDSLITLAQPLLS